ncbi:UV-damage endonuclease [Cnuella takakiae]|uniref:UV-damage endonuclease n=1 Tax=Cnuella takakiae TaxID=1302690 RepID=A0A1M4WIZ5_9BACT|nr:UV DNA damage repair endonuclease UvsE [Cnuella takakiae]OLY91702.1 UV damage repair endonuclease UvsE [Cnuella takakiae]SHE81196.1 UV-damage endonuclease [Cnuella takakiae]
MINLGYACININLNDQGVSSSKGMIRRTFLEKGVQYASQIALQNVQGLLQIVEWNVQQGIKVFRVSSDLMPWASEYNISELPDFPEIRATLEAVGRHNIRLTTHPGPFNKMAGSGATLNNTIRDLEIHSEVFDLMGLPATPMHKINIHVGGAYGDKDETIRRFARNFSLLSQNLRGRLSVENDDKAGLYTVADLVPLHEMIGVPIVFDYFHHKLHPGNLSEEEAFHTAFATWRVKPIFHFSSSRRDWEEPTAKREAHADFIYEPINTYGKEVDIVLEAKMKELAVQRYMEQFGNPGGNVGA